MPWGSATVLIFEYVLVALFGGVLLAAGGYLLGLRRGTASQQRLRQALVSRQQELHRARLEFSGALKAERSGRLQSDPVAGACNMSAALEARLKGLERRSDEHTLALMSELQKLRGDLPGPATLKEALATELRAVMGPVADGVHRQAVLTALAGEYLHRGHLSKLLAAVAAHAGLAAVVLSDDAGLLLAETAAESSEGLAAAGSLLVTLTDRLDSFGQPGVIGAVVRDAQSRWLLYRIFMAGPERYVLIGVSDEAALAPHTLDPVLPQIRRLLVLPGMVPERLRAT